VSPSRIWRGDGRNGLIRHGGFVERLEHIPDDAMGDVVAAMLAVLKPGGHAVHWVPAFEGIFGTIDESFGHYRRYDRKTASKLFSAHAHGKGISHSVVSY